jgi:hypothetical protein
MMFQEYPKWIPVQGHEDGGIVVWNKEEELNHGMQKEAPEEVTPKKRGRPKKVNSDAAN